ncbi:sensor histidine kinase [Lapidilactobacillus salsurivasis]
MFKKLRAQRRTNNLARLVRLYAVILIIALTIAASILVLIQMRNYNSDVSQAREASINRASDILYTRQHDTDTSAARLSDSAEKLRNLNHFFSDSPSAYLEYTFDHDINGSFYYLPNQLGSILRNNDDIKEIIINPAGDNRYYVFNSAGGRVIKSKKAPDVQGAFTVTSNLIDPTNLRTVATYYQIYDNTTLNDRLAQLTGNYQEQLFVTSYNGQQLYHYASAGVTAAEQRRARRRLARILKGSSFDALEQLNDQFAFHYDLLSVNGGNADFVIIALNNRRKQLENNLRRVSWIILGWALITTLLFIMLRLTFSRYQEQLGGIMKAMRAIGNEELASRVPVPKNDGELRTLADGINGMLDQIQQYVQEIYQVQIDQQEANMRALQAQINPHFLYNTLEYIRMSALSAGEIELADVIYNFATLMRHSISTGTTNATLAEETQFVEKYIYLYQLRFPKQLAYQIRLDEDILPMRVPKFTLQPLVENYFVHGVDFSRDDNAIRLQGHRQDEETVIIEIINNGDPIPPARLAELQTWLAATDPTDPTVLTQEPVKSIGLRNVADRIKNFYGTKSHLEINNNEYGGVTIRLVLITG